MVNIVMAINLAGKILVSPPNIIDRRFANSVIYIAEHEEASGAWGVMVNRTSEIPASRIMEKAAIDLHLNGTVHLGGPVEIQRLIMLHSSDVISSETIMSNSGICVSNDMEFIGKMIDGDRPRYLKAIIGICSWGPGQLEGEIAGVPPWRPEHSWLIGEPDMETIFELDDIDLWTESVHHCAKSTVKDWMV